MESMLSSDFHVKPKKFRLFFVVLLVLLLGVIWGGTFYAVRLVRENLESSMRTSIETKTVVLEEPVSRALDAVGARMDAVVALTPRYIEQSPPQAASALKQLIYDDRVIRSISLVDAKLRVVASSTMRNVGVSLPDDFLPESKTRPGSAVVDFGRVFPYRDLYEVGQAPIAGAENAFWLVSSPVRVDDNVYHWVAALNVGLFLNLWDRTSNDASTAITLYDYAGQVIATNRELARVDQTALGNEILEQVKQRLRGYFEFGPRYQIMVSYRGSSDHSVILAVIGDPLVLMQQHSASFNQYYWAAGVLSLLLMLITGVLYRWYIRYEISVSELSNQAKAMGAHLIISESDPGGRIVGVNDAFLAVSGYAREELIGKNHRMFNSGMYAKSFYTELWETLSAGKIWKGTFRNINKARRYYWVQVTIVPFTDAWGKISRYVALYTDITDAIVQSEKFLRERRLREELTRINRELVNDTNTDTLTGIANRRAFASFSDQIIKNTHHSAYPVSALMIDLDFFKTVNDSFGHEAGDVVLWELARRGSTAVRTSDMLARVGGEEFCVLLHNSNSAQAVIVAEKIRAITSSQPVFYEDPATKRTVEIPITVSIGVATADSLREVVMDELLRVADAALYEAKHAGRYRVVARKLD